MICNFFLERVRFLINQSNFSNFQKFFKFYFIQTQTKFVSNKIGNKSSNSFTTLARLLLENDIFLMLRFFISFITSVFSIFLRENMLLLLIPFHIVTILRWFRNLALISSRFLVSDEEVYRNFFNSKIFQNTDKNFLEFFSHFFYS